MFRYVLLIIYYILCDGTIIPVYVKDVSRIYIFSEVLEGLELKKLWIELPEEYTNYKLNIYIYLYVCECGCVSTEYVSVHVW